MNKNLRLFLPLLTVLCLPACAPASSPTSSVSRSTPASSFSSGSESNSSKYSSKSGGNIKLFNFSGLYAYGNFYAPSAETRYGKIALPLLVDSSEPFEFEKCTIYGAAVKVVDAKFYDGNFGISGMSGGVKFQLKSLEISLDLGSFLAPIDIISINVVLSGKSWSFKTDYQLNPYDARYSGIHDNDIFCCASSQESTTGSPFEAYYCLNPQADVQVNSVTMAPGFTVGPISESLKTNVYSSCELPLSAAAASFHNLKVHYNPSHSPLFCSSLAVFDVTVGSKEEKILSQPFPSLTKGDYDPTEWCYLASAFFPPVFNYSYFSEPANYSLGVS